MAIPRVRLNILGPPAIYVGGRKIDCSSPQLWAILACLALGREPVSRERLSTLIWPHAERRTRLHNLSQALYRLRRLLGPGVAKATQERVELIGVDCDFVHWKQRIANEDRSAADTLRGPFLDGIRWDSPDFEAWLEPFRVEFRRLLMQLVDQLVRSSDSDRLARVAEVCQAVTDREPSSQGFSDFLERQQQGLGTRSSAAVADQATQEASISVFVGRTGELGTLTRLWDQVQAGGVEVALITGSPGVGKTALCQRLLRYVAIKGGRTLLSSAYSSEQNLPFGVVSQLLSDAGIGITSLASPWIEILRASFPGLEGLSQTEQGQSAGQGGELALYEALRQVIAAMGPAAIFLDDAEWCDPASLGFLHYLSRLPTGSGTLVLCAARQNSHFALRALLRPATHLILKEFTRAEVRELALRLRGSHYRAGEDLDNLFARTGGNPLLVKALLEMPPDQHPRRPPEVVEDVLRPRLVRLPENAQSVLAALSTVGRKATTSMIAEVANLTLDEASAGLGNLIQEGLAAEENEGFSSTHGLAGEILLGDLPSVEKRLLYARAARALRQGGAAPSAVLAVTYDIAGEPENSYEHALNAASASIRLYAHREAEYFLKLALSHAPSPLEKAKILLRLSRLFIDLGRADEAIGLLQPESAVDELRLRFDAYRIVAGIVSGRDPVPLLSAAKLTAEQAVNSQDPELAGFLLSCMGRAAHEAGLRSEAIEISRKLLRVAEQITDVDGAQQLRIRAAGIIGLSESVVEGLSLLEASSASTSNPRAALATALAKGSILVAAGRLKAAEENILSAAGVAERLGLYANIFLIYNNLACCYIEGGRYLEAEMALRRAMDLSSTSLTNTLFALDNLSVLEFERGDHARALGFAEQSFTMNTPVISERSWFSSRAMLGLCYYHNGSLAEASECEREIRLAVETYEYWLSDISYVETFLARMSVYRGKSDEAVGRLMHMSELYKSRDFFCSSRLHVESLRLQRLEPSGAVIAEARRLYSRLIKAGAEPLAERLSLYVPGVQGN